MVPGSAFPQVKGYRWSGAGSNCRPSAFQPVFPLPRPFPRRRVKAQLTSVTAGQWTNAAMLPLFRPGPPTSVLSVGFLCQHAHSQPLCGHSVGPASRRIPALPQSSLGIRTAMPESKVLAAPRSSSPGGWHVIYPRQPSSRGLRLSRRVRIRWELALCGKRCRVCTGHLLSAWIVRAVRSARSVRHQAPA